MAFSDLTGQEREKIYDSFPSLEGYYYCDKTWSAWSMGTMVESDFHPASEDSDLIESCCKEVFNAATELLVEKYLNPLRKFSQGIMDVVDPGYYSRHEISTLLNEMEEVFGKL